MAKTHAENRFEKSRKRLAQVLKNLEEVVKDKIHETAINAKMIDVSDDIASIANARLIEQSSMIQNLNEEINNLQKNLSELGKETETLNEENKNLTTKLNKFQKESKKLIESIEADIIKIEEVMHDN